MFEKFLERSGNSIKLEEFSEDYIRQYNNLVLSLLYKTPFHEEKIELSSLTSIFIKLPPS